MEEEKEKEERAEGGAVEEEPSWPPWPDLNTTSWYRPQKRDVTACA